MEHVYLECFWLVDDKRQVVGVASMGYLEGDMHHRANFGNKNN